MSMNKDNAGTPKFRQDPAFIKMMQGIVPGYSSQVKDSQKEAELPALIFEAQPKDRYQVPLTSFSDGEAFINLLIDRREVFIRAIYDTCEQRRAMAKAERGLTKQEEEEHERALASFNEVRMTEEAQEFLRLHPYFFTHVDRAFYKLLLDAGRLSSLVRFRS